jgi:tetratricopeptide repeat protein 21B
MSAEKVQALVNYYAREGQSRHIQTVCNEVLRKRPNDPLLIFWRAFGLLLEGSYSEVRGSVVPYGDDGWGEDA